MNTVLALVSVLAAAKQQSNPIGLFLPIVLVGGVAYFLLIAPQRKQRARQTQLRSTIEVGDEVLTTGGIIGTVTFLDDDLAHLEVDHDVVIRVSRAAISRSLSEPDPAAPPAKKSGGFLGSLMGGGATAAERTAVPDDDDGDDDGGDDVTDTKGPSKKRN